MVWKLKKTFQEKEKWHFQLQTIQKSFIMTANKVRNFMVFCFILYCSFQNSPLHVSATSVAKKVHSMLQKLKSDINPKRWNFKKKNTIMTKFRH